MKLQLANLTKGRHLHYIVFETRYAFTLELLELLSANMNMNQRLILRKDNTYVAHDYLLKRVDVLELFIHFKKMEDFFHEISTTEHNSKNATCSIY